MRDDEVLERRVVLPAAPEVVWRAITRRDELSAWFGADVELDLRPGGRALFVAPNGERRHGIVREVEEGRRLVFRWWPAGPSGDGTPVGAATTVEMVVADAPDGAELTVTESSPASSGTGWLVHAGHRFGASSARLALVAEPSRD